jgi:hypothetical protein
LFDKCLALFLGGRAEAPQLRIKNGDENEMWGNEMWLI